MGKQPTVVNLDPIDRKKELNWFGRLMITRYAGGKSVVKSEPFGHYMFCGKQRSGKTASVLWYAEKLTKKYKKRRLKFEDHELCNHEPKENEPEIVNCKMVKFEKAPAIKLWSNFGVGTHIDKLKVFDLIDKFDPYANEIRIVLIDEFHTYFPKDSKRKEDKEILADLTAVFSQLAKRNCFVLSTAQVYGRLDKSLREQCLYMVDNHVNFRRRIVSEFIPESDILVDDLGRWSGNPTQIYVHGLSTVRYDNKRLIRE